MLLTVALLFLLFGVLQVGVYVYARNVISAAAADGARSGSALDADPAEGGRRAHKVINRGLTAHIAKDVPCEGAATYDPDSHLPVTTVRCHGRLGLLFLPLSMPLVVDVHASALRERQP